nr:MAG TPA: hypothetical protein [Caudoviricetes sp.]
MLQQGIDSDHKGAYCPNNNPKTFHVTHLTIPMCAYFARR